MATRRKFLKILGGGTILAATGATAFVTTRNPAQALAPWDVQSYADPRKHALAHAILAPNPHNRQPWLVELSGEDTVILHRDVDRDLPATDPYNRQIFIGLGCFLELLTVSASDIGFGVDLNLFPEGENGPVAIATFRKGAKRDPLADNILTRRSDKFPYEAKSLAQSDADALTSFAAIITEQTATAALRTITKDAFNVEIYTPYTFEESVDLIRIGKAEINANPDGIELSSPMLEVLRRFGLLTKDVLMDTDHPAFKSQHADYLRMLDATPAYAVLTTQTNTRQDQIEAGRRWLRLNLKTTELGLALHPVSQALQEYPEMTAIYEKAHQMLAPQGDTVQMLGRLGYGPKGGPTPRWNLESRIKNG